MTLAGFELIVPVAPATLAQLMSQVWVTVLNWKAALSQLHVLVDVEGVVACEIEPQSISQAAVTELKLNEVMH